jgi:3-oxoacyl-[acyl-carrier-protein] synthase II
MNKRVVITGLGAVSSIGIGWESFWDSLVAGRSGISDVTSFDTSGHFTHKGGEIKIFIPDEFIPPDKLNILSRSSQFAVAAAHLAVRDAHLSPDELSAITAGICIGTTMGSVQTSEIINQMIVLQGKTDFSNDLICQVPTHSTPAAVAREFGITGPNLMFSTACSAGNYAIGYGLDLIRLGKTDVILAGGSDPFSKVAFTGFNQFGAVAPEKCQPFDKNRKGMMVAEGAGMLIIESLDHALTRNAPIYAEIAGYGLSCDAHHMTLPSVEGVSRCMMQALRETRITTEQVDYICAHGTGTPANDRAECAAIRNVFGSRTKDVPVSSIKSMIGHTMGAASALEAISCALTVKNNLIPPTINYETPDPECDIDCVPNQARGHEVNIALNNSYAFGGNNASLILRKYIP